MPVHAFLVLVRVCEAASACFFHVSLSVLMHQMPSYLQNKDEFQSMLEASKAGPKCKQLALSELPKYVGRYPDFAGDSRRMSGPCPCVNMYA